MVTGPSGSFVMVDPEHVSKVGPAAAVLYGRICWRSERTGTWKASRALLASETGLSLDVIRTALRVLREAGWLESERASTLDATLVWRPIPAGQPEIGHLPISIEGISPTLDVGTSPISSYETGKTLPPTPTVDDQPDLFDTQIGPRRSQQEDLAGFDGWWESYPRKVAKGDARKAWRQVTRDVSPAVIQAGLERQIAALRLEHERGFCPYPATWLRAERWADDDNVHPLRRTTGADLGSAYDPEFAATLPPPRTDPFARGGAL